MRMGYNMPNIGTASHMQDDLLVFVLFLSKFYFMLVSGTGRGANGMMEAHKKG